MLPDFKGVLGPAPWSGFRLTAAIEANLRQAASPKCPQCAGAGYLGPGAKILGDKKDAPQAAGLQPRRIGAPLSS
jgi:hypothetical protein